MTREEALRIIKIVLYVSADFEIIVQGEELTEEKCKEAVEIVTKALEQESCDDEYIKVPKKALKYRTAGMVAYNAEWLKNHFDMERAIICGAQEPCDAVSRKAAIDACLKGLNRKEMVSNIKALPPVTPAEKVGHWEWVQYDGNPNIGNWHCSECNRIVCGAITAVNPVYSYKYCPECGSKMQEVEDT